MLDCTLQAEAGFGPSPRWTDQPVGGSNPGSTSPKSAVPTCENPVENDWDSCVLWLDN